MPDLITRPRRLRSFQALRNLVAESRLDRAMLVQPHFVVPGTGISDPIEAMPGIEHQSVDRLVATVGADLGLGIRSLLLFRVPEESYKAPDGPRRVGRPCGGGRGQCVPSSANSATTWW
jgi:porphobilinogen synthase